MQLPKVQIAEAEQNTESVAGDKEYTHSFRTIMPASIRTARLQHEAPNRLGALQPPKYPRMAPFPAPRQAEESRTDAAVMEPLGRVIKQESAKVAEARQAFDRELPVERSKGEIFKPAASENDAFVASYCMQKADFAQNMTEFKKYLTVKAEHQEAITKR